MIRFFINKSDILCNKIEIRNEEVHHIRNVLRKKVNNEIVGFCGDGYNYYILINDIKKDVILGEIIKKERIDSEPKTRLFLYQAIGKGKKLEWVIEKAVEIGVIKIFPVITERTISRPKEYKRKLSHWRDICLASSLQSNRAIIPEVGNVLSFFEALTHPNPKIIFWEKATKPLKNILKEINSNTLCLYFGPEGGFSEREINLAKEKGAFVASLGKRILRTETAPLVALSSVLSLRGEI